MAETTFRPVNLATEVPGFQRDEDEVTRVIKVSQVTKITSMTNNPGIGPTATLGVEELTGGGSTTPTCGGTTTVEAQHQAGT